MTKTDTQTFDKGTLQSYRNRTPFFVFNASVLQSNLKKFQSNLPPQTEICYAMKANSERGVLKTLSEAGASFEVASKYELALLKSLAVPPHRIVYGTAVKSADHIRAFARYGVDRFAFDSLQELHKIAKYAPNSRVYVRTLVDDRSDSVFHMSEKFGSRFDHAVGLLEEAQKLKLIPYGISFNVGSQARNKDAWSRGIKDVSHLMEALLQKNIKIETIDVGGGFPFSYQGVDEMPQIEEIGNSIRQAIQGLPYEVKLIVEPGRALVADAFALVSSVIERTVRPTGEWLYIDAGVYNALFEATPSQGLTKYRVEPLRDHSEDTQSTFVLTGPTGDDIDVVNRNISLPADMKTGEKLIIHDAGAYTFPLATKFNGFPKPRILEL